MFEIDVLQQSLITKKRVSKILQCNEVLQRYGLLLKEKEAIELLKTQQESLKEVGRIELQGQIIEELLQTFCDSQFFTKYDYVDTVHELIEIFYYYREATEGLLSDEEIIKYLYVSFEGACQGSLQWLGDNQLNILLDNLNEGKDIFKEARYGKY